MAGLGVGWAVTRARWQSSATGAIIGGSRAPKKMTLLEEFALGRIITLDGEFQELVGIRVVVHRNPICNAQLPQIGFTLFFGPAIIAA